MSRSEHLQFFTAAILAAAIPVGFGFGQAQSNQGWEVVAGGKMAFDVASVRLSPGPIKPSNFRLSPDDAYTNTGGLLIADFPLATYIEFAYKIQPTREQFESLYAHVPRWVQTDNYEIHARAIQQNPTKDQMRLMMQALLRERFQLQVHFETEDTPVLEMSLLKPGTLGPELHRHQDGPPCSVTAPPAAGVLGIPGGVDLRGPDVFPARCGGIEAVPKPHQMMLMGGRDTTIEMIASYLAIGRLGLPVINETGLTGKYDFTLNWAPQPGAFGRGPVGAEPQGAPASEPEGPTFVEAVREQLGLKLKPGKAQLKVLAIDHVDRPSEN